MRHKAAKEALQVKSMLRYSVEKLHAKKRDFEKQGYQVGEMKKIGFAFSRLAGWWKWKI